MGGTEIAQPLEDVVFSEGKGNEELRIFVLTDG